MGLRWVLYGDVTDVAHFLRASQLWKTEPRHSWTCWRAYHPQSHGILFLSRAVYRQEESQTYSVRNECADCQLFMYCTVDWRELYFKVTSWQWKDEKAERVSDHFRQWLYGHQDTLTWVYSWCKTHITHARKCKWTLMIQLMQVKRGKSFICFLSKSTINPFIFENNTPCADYWLNTTSKRQKKQTI